MQKALSYKATLDCQMIFYGGKRNKMEETRGPYKIINLKIDQRILRAESSHKEIDEKYTLTNVEMWQVSSTVSWS